VCFSRDDLVSGNQLLGANIFLRISELEL
jgi:hypothetical protein